MSKYILVKSCIQCPIHCALIREDFEGRIHPDCCLSEQTEEFLNILKEEGKNEVI